MESRFDIVRIASAVGVAAYVACAIGYLALDRLGLSPQEIAGAAVLLAVAIASGIAIDFVGKALRQ